jgi:hypothetical protein
MGARITAKRLSLLLPTAQQAVHAAGKSVVDGLSARPPWLRVTILIGAMGIGIAINVMLMSAPTPPADAAANHGLLSPAPSDATLRPLSPVDPCRPPWTVPTRCRTAQQHPKGSAPKFGTADTTTGSDACQ